jgi:hypothetical protein
MDSMSTYGLDSRTSRSYSTHSGYHEEKYTSAPCAFPFLFCVVLLWLFLCVTVHVMEDESFVGGGEKRGVSLCFRDSFRRMIQESRDILRVKAL